MKQRKLLIVVLFVLAGGMLSARPDYSPEELAKTQSYRERLGHNKRDSIAAEKFYVDYVNAFRKASESGRPEDWKECYRPWKNLMRLAPYATYNLTNTGGGIYMLTKLMEAETDEVLRYVYFKDMMNTLRFRIDNRDNLNAIPKDGGEKRIPLSFGSALMWKAHHYRAQGMKYIPESTYRKDSAYRYYSDAFARIRKESVDADNEIDPAYLSEYFEACRDLYVSDKDRYMEQFLTDYTTCLETCDKMMSVYANGKDDVRWEYYAGVRNNIEVWFGQTGAGNADNLEKFYSLRLDGMKNNYPLLKNAIHLMMTNDTLLTSDLFYKACRYSYKLHPDFENCIGMAQAERNQQKNRDEAMKYFLEAEKLASTPGEKFITGTQIALALMSEPVPSKNSMPEEFEQLSTAEKNDLVREWQARQNVAARMLNEAIGYGRSAGVNGQNLAPYYLYMAQAYRRSEDAKTIDLAMQALNQIPSLYPAFPQNRINDERMNIQNVKSNLAKRAANEEQYRKNKVAYEKWQKQQAEIMAKRKAEEDFWLRK